MKVIDFRFRPNTQATIDGFTNSTMFKGMFEKIDLTHMKAQTVPQVVEDLKKHHVVKAVITGRDCESTYDAASNNAGVIDFVQSFPEIFLGFVGLDPHKGMKAVAELQHSVESLGMHGASIDPYLARIPANDAKYYPLYAKCCELDVPMVISTGPAIRPGKKILFSAGILGGFMGTLSGVSMPPLALALQNRPGPELRGTIACVGFLSVILSTIALAMVDRLGIKEFQLALCLAPGVVLGYVLSFPVAERFDKRCTRPAVCLLSTISAVAMIVRYL